MINLATIFCRGIFIISVVEINGCIATLTVISVGCIVASITGTVVCCIVRAPKAASANEPPVVSYIDHVGYDSLQARYFEMDGTYTSLRYDEDAILQTITGNNDMPTYCTIIE
ncbi:uncharacterized protein LOC125673405 isoform X2 [Ostrea edulis]|uniref:uncharacterized protein LOC125673405 isoform X2 n=1 Tax=Ostrea edulis TaxID=37623 RepID=UPI002094FC41|nr:uncharacterized protein LOC125673405 isoform X2 [Ostrea edulis]